VAELGQTQQVGAVPKAVQVGHQFHVPFAGIGVQGENVFAGERVATQRDLRMAGEIKGVLRIQLQHVHLEQGAAVHDGLERVQRRHLAAGDVQHHAPVGKHGPVINLARGPERALQAHDLPKRLYGMVQRDDALTAGQYALSADRDAVRLLTVRCALLRGKGQPQVPAGFPRVVAE